VGTVLRGKEREKCQAPELTLGLALHGIDERWMDEIHGWCVVWSTGPGGGLAGPGLGAGVGVGEGVDLGGGCGCGCVR
jgi:hypothetical protein